MRHAKSSWGAPAITDHDRPLNARGRHAARLMAEGMLVRGLLPDTILCSSAFRARQTLTPLLDRMDGKMSLTISRELYEATAPDYTKLISDLAKTAPNAKTVLLIGHNFAIQDAAISFAVPDDTDTLFKLKTKFPTGAIAVLDLQNELGACGPSSARLFDFLRPRDL